MGQNPVPPVHIPVPAEKGSKMGAPKTPKWDLMGFDNHSHFFGAFCLARLNNFLPTHGFSVLNSTES